MFFIEKGNLKVIIKIKLLNKIICWLFMDFDFMCENFYWYKILQKIKNKNKLITINLLKIIK